MNYYGLPNTPQASNPNPPNPPPITSNPSHVEKTSNSFDSMFSFFTIPVPQAEQTSKSPRPANQQIREGEKYFVLTSDLLRLKQSDAAARLDIHPSTFSKKWRQSLPDRKWPYRKHCKIERQIKKLKDQGDTLSEGQLKELVTMREKNLEPAVIVISDSDTTPQSKASTPQTAPTTSTTTNTATKTSATSTPTSVTATTPTTTSTPTSTPTASDPTKATPPIVNPLNTSIAAPTSPQPSTLPPQVYTSSPPGGGVPPITPTHSILPLPSAGTEL